MSGAFDGAGPGSYREASTPALVILIAAVVIAVAIVWSAEWWGQLVAPGGPLPTPLPDTLPLP